MKIRLLIKLLMTVVIGSGAATVFAQGFDRVDFVNSLLKNGVGYMKPDQSIVYTREYVDPQGDDDRCKYTFYDKDLKAFASISDIESQSILRFDNGLDNNNLISSSEFPAHFTQTFFNDDDDIEYVVKKEDTTKMTLEVKQVISGKTIATCDIDVPCHENRLEFCCEGFFNLAGNHYVELSVEWADAQGIWDTQHMIYRVNKSDSGAGMFKLVSETKTKAYPNPVNRGEFFNLQLSGCDGGAVVIFDLSGKYIKTVEISDGAASIATDDMQQGMYIYNVQSKGRTIGKNKLIVK